MRALVAVTATAAMVASALPAPAGAASGKVAIKVLSNRADVISGGDALVQVVRPPDARRARFKVTVGGRDVSAAFGKDGVGLVKGLENGRNVVTVRLRDGRGARITITNHPIGGPVFAGRQLTPWICQAGAKDAQCNRPASVSYQYMDALTAMFAAYNPASPPPSSRIATTTTDQGKKVPYVVRVENGVQDRGSYAIAVLDAAGAWNSKLLTRFGPNTAPHYSQPSPSPVLDDKALSRGFMVANNGLQIHGENTNDVVSTEAFMMLKEHIIERYGQIRYTIAEGCSGGSYQVMDEAMYPGLLDGLQPNCTYVDLWTTAMDVFDCGLFVHYFSGQSLGGPPLGLWMPSIDGHRDPSACASWDALFYTYVDPTNADHCNLDPSLVYNPDTNPRGVRCTIADYMISIFGPRPRSVWTAPERAIGRGFANVPWGNEGVQYGLRALRSGQISGDQFVDLNRKMGGITVDGEPQLERNLVDATTASIAYRSGAVMDASRIEDVPIIDLRAYSETGEIHTSGNSVKLRARLDRANGHHDNQITWTWNNTVPIVGVTPPKEIELQSFLLIDKWLARVEADGRDIPKAQKVALDKPRDAVDACFITTLAAAAPDTPAPPSLSQRITDPAQCNALYPSTSLTRPAAGAPATDDIVQCALSPIDPEDYLPATLTGAQLTQLRTIFPRGVCDYGKPGVGQQHSVPWSTYENGPGGEPLGVAPTSRVLRRCTTKRTVQIPIRVRRGTRVRSIEVYVDGRRAKTGRGARRHVSARRVSLRLRSRKGRTVRVLVKVRARRGGRPVTLRVRRTYTFC